VRQDEIDTRMPLAERKQVCGAHLHSALLVPITSNGEVTAVITLAEVRRRNRREYTPDDIAFVEAVAAGLSAALSLRLVARQGRSVESPRTIRARDGHNNPTIRGRLRSSLSSILGSVEMIRHSRHQPDAGLDKYLGIIDSSAQRINHLFEDQQVR
jgi:GAF domain-containing protein